MKFCVQGYFKVNHRSGKGTLLKNGCVTLLITILFSFLFKNYVSKKDYLLEKHFSTSRSILAQSEGDCVIFKK